MFWLRLKNSIRDSFWWIYLRRERKLIDFTPEELDNMWDDDTIDIKNFSHLEPGPAKNEMRLMLTDRMNWYKQQKLTDWAEQINVALWLDEKDASDAQAPR